MKCMKNQKQVLACAAFLMICCVARVGFADITAPAALYHFDGNGDNSVSSLSATAGGNASFSGTDHMVGTQGMSLPANTDWASMPLSTSLDGSNNFTITFWAKPGSGTSEYSRLISFGDNSKFYIEWRSSFYRIFNTGYASADAYSYIPLADTGLGDWQFWAIRADGDMLQVFQGTYDGSQWNLNVVTTADRFAIAGGEGLNGSGTVYLGNNALGTAGMAGSAFDELAVWNTGLDDMQIQEVLTITSAGTNLVPEPASAFVLLAGVFGAAFRIRNRKK